MSLQPKRCLLHTTVCTMHSLWTYQCPALYLCWQWKLLTQYWHVICLMWIDHICDWVWENQSYCPCQHIWFAAMNRMVLLCNGLNMYVADKEAKSVSFTFIWLLIYALYFQIIFNIVRAHGTTNSWTYEFTNQYYRIQK